MSAHTPEQPICGDCNIRALSDAVMEIEFCPTHREAPAMLAMLRILVEHGEPCADCGQVDMHPVDRDTGMSCLDRAANRARALLAHIDGDA